MEGKLATRLELVISIPFFNNWELEVKLIPELAMRLILRGLLSTATLR